MEPEEEPGGAAVREVYEEVKNLERSAWNAVWICILWILTDDSFKQT